jgi:hypothetical protein
MMTRSGRLFGCRESAFQEDQPIPQEKGVGVGHGRRSTKDRKMGSCQNGMLSPASADAWDVPGVLKEIKHLTEN